MNAYICTRSVSTSVVFLKDVSISEIYRAVPWASAHAFAEHYVIFSNSASNAVFGSTALSSKTDSNLKPQPCIRDTARESPPVEPLIGTLRLEEVVTHLVQ